MSNFIKMMLKCNMYYVIIVKEQEIILNILKSLNYQCDDVV